MPLPCPSFSFTTLSFLSLFFWNSLFFLLARISFFVGAFFLSFAGNFGGSVGTTNPCFLGGFPPFFQKKQGTEGHGSVDGRLAKRPDLREAHALCLEEKLFAKMLGSEVGTAKSRLLFPETIHAKHPDSPLLVFFEETNKEIIKKKTRILLCADRQNPWKGKEKRSQKRKSSQGEKNNAFQNCKERGIRAVSREMLRVALAKRGPSKIKNYHRFELSALFPGP